MTSSNGNIFLRYWPFARGIHRSPVNSQHKGQWREALMFSLICAWINGWVNNREPGDLRRHRLHYDVTVMGKFVCVGEGHPSSSLQCFSEKSQLPMNCRRWKFTLRTHQESCTRFAFCCILLWISTNQFYPFPPELPQWRWIVPTPVKQLWRICVN